MRTWLSGRALASQAEDREFESRRPLHTVIATVSRFSINEKRETFFVLVRAKSITFRYIPSGSIRATTTTAFAYGLALAKFSNTRQKA